MDIGKSFSYIFEDPRWLNKVLIGTLVLIISSLLTPILIGLLGFAILGGYGLEVLKNVRRGDKYPMPEWRERWGEWLVLGLKLYVVLLVWSLPLILVSIPMSIGFGLMDQGDSEAVGALLAACFGCLTLLWTIVVVVASPAIFIRVAETEDLTDGLQFGRILTFTRDNIGEVIIASVVYLIASFVVSLIGSIVGVLLCLVGLLVTLPAAQFITTLIQSHLYAQIGLGRQPWQTTVEPAYPLAPVEASPQPPAPVEPAVLPPAESDDPSI